MKILLFTFTLMFLSLFSDAQTRLVVIDGVSRAPLSYATIQSIQKKEGFITDENGFIQLNLTLTDTIHVSYVGYKPINYVVGNITNDKIELFKEIGSTLPDVIVKKYTPIGKPIRLGFHNLKMSWRMRGGLNRNKKYVGQEITTLVEFPNENDKYKLLKVILPTNKIEKNDPLRLHIYSIKDNGEPFEELLINDVVIDKGSNLFSNIEVDISNQNIVLNSKGIFVGIQWVGYFDGEVKNTTDVSFTQEINKVNTYVTSNRYFNKTWFNKGIVNLENTSPSNLKVGLVLQKMK